MIFPSRNIQRRVASALAELRSVFAAEVDSCSAPWASLRRYTDERRVDSQGPRPRPEPDFRPWPSMGVAGATLLHCSGTPGLVGALRQELLHDVCMAGHCRNHEGCLASDTATSSPRARTVRDNRRCCPKVCSEGGGFGLDCSLAVRRRPLNRSVKATRGCGHRSSAHPVQGHAVRGSRKQQNTEATRGSRQLVSAKCYHLVSPSQG